MEAKHRKEESCDRLSHLPDHLLISIISSLPVKQAAATSVLSKRWRYLWHFITHLELDDMSPFDHTLRRHAQGDVSSLDQDYMRLTSMLDGIEVSVQGPIHSTKVSFLPSPALLNNYIICLDDFLFMLVEMDIKELSILNKGEPNYDFPPEVFFCQSLNKLELAKCTLCLPPSSSGHFSTIKSLILSLVDVDDDQFAEVILCCKVLENLKVDNCVKIQHFRITGPKLSSLEVTTRYGARISLEDVAKLRDVTIEILSSVLDIFDDDYSPFVSLVTDLSQGCMERLSLKFFTTHNELLKPWVPESAPKLHTVKKLRTVTKLKFVASLSAPCNASFLAFLLDSCPNLEDLVVQDRKDRWSSFDTILDRTRNYWETQSALKCLTDRVRIVTLEEVSFHNYWIRLMKFLLRNACVCEKMFIRYEGHEFLFSEENELQLLQWASNLNYIMSFENELHLLCQPPCS